MQAVFQKGSLTAVSDAYRIIVHPKAEGGRGTIHIYDRNGEVLNVILLDTIDAAIFTNDANIAPELLALIPEPVVKKEEIHE